MVRPVGFLAEPGGRGKEGQGLSPVALACRCARSKPPALENRDASPASPRGLVEQGA